MKRAAALIAVFGGILATTGSFLAFGVAGGLITAGLFLVAAGASEL